MRKPIIELLSMNGKSFLNRRSMGLSLKCPFREVVGLWSFSFSHGDIDTGHECRYADDMTDINRYADDR